MTKALQTLKEKLAVISDFATAEGLLSWDMEVYMPPKGAEARGRQLTTLASHVHALSTDSEIGRLIEEAFSHSDNYSVEDKALLREAKKDYERDTKLPAPLVEAFAKITSEAHLTWVEARKNADFKHFESVLTRIVDLNKQKADALGYEGSPYNALLDLYEPGLTVAQLDPLFESLKAPLQDIIKTIAGREKPDFSFLKQEFPPDKQLAFGQQVLKDMGFDFEAGRQDLAPHPFCSGTSPSDVRLTTRVYPNDLVSALFSSMHEGGHGLYEQGVALHLDGTPLGGGVSLGIHESQSRLWENIIGRSRAFWTYYYPKLQAMFPEQLNKVDLDLFCQGINQVKPSMIRVESDEVTYNLHILLRYEIERDLLENKLKVSDIPDLWNSKMHDYLGITPENHAEGCLQDIHWSHGTLGYFPTYTIGNICAAQFYKTAQTALPDLETQISAGKLLPLREWLKENIHQYGRIYEPSELLQRVCQEPMNSQYLVDYFKSKFL